MPDINKHSISWHLLSLTIGIISVFIVIIGIANIVMTINSNSNNNIYRTIIFISPVLVFLMVILSNIFFFIGTKSDVGNYRLGLLGVILGSLSWLFVCALAFAIIIIMLLPLIIFILSNIGGG
jgi:hypothetical protein